MRKSFLIAILMLLSFLAVPSALAQYTPPQPGPGKGFFIDKKIFNPQALETKGATSSANYVDNLSRDQYLFAPNQTVFFQLIVTNTGNDDLNNIEVTDKLPPQLSYIRGGSVNQGGQIHFTIDKLAANSQSQPLFIETRVSVDQAFAGIICPVNFAQAQTGSLVDQDTSSFCIQQNVVKQMPPAEQLPRTGLPLVAWSVVGLLPVGFRLRKFSSSNKDKKEDANYIWQIREFLKEGGDRI
ncbi:MAG: hypothetical protein Q7R77_02230 [Candidatus Daviesbacteria bacterium]|nr:hypothetical protein [Candidatus Daviesbacteria bacterium]